MTRPLRRTAEEIKPQPELQRSLAEHIAKVIVGNPAMLSSWQYERIILAIEEYTQAAVKESA